MNEIAINVEIDFYEQEVASIFHETNVIDVDELFAELVFCAAFAIRSMSNLGESDTTLGLAQQLQAMSQVMLKAPQELGGLVPQLIDYPGRPGRKRFLSDLRFNNSELRLGYGLKGFGIFSTGVGYYVPVAVNALFRYFALRRADNSNYRNAISEVAATCGQLQLDRQIKVGNHPQLVMVVIGSSLMGYLPTWLR